MAFTRSVVILANSIKQGEHCVAGKDIRTGEWIRPVTTPEGGALPREKVMVKNPYGIFVAKPLQYVEMTFEKPAPIPAQPENCLLAPRRWTQRFKARRDQLHSMLDNPEHLWMYGDRSDRFPVEALGNIRRHQSLYFVHTDAIHFRIGTNFRGHKRIIGTFFYNGTLYSMVVTDPGFFDHTRLDIGHEWEENDRYLCLSQTDTFNGYCYKVIAAIL